MVRPTSTMGHKSEDRVYVLCCCALTCSISGLERAVTLARTSTTFVCHLGNLSRYWRVERPAFHHALSANGKVTAQYLGGQEAGGFYMIVRGMVSIALCGVCATHYVCSPITCSTSVAFRFQRMRACSYRSTTIDMILFATHPSCNVC
jgi:hypothetical protein